MFVLFTSQQNLRLRYPPNKTSFNFLFDGKPMKLLWMYNFNIIKSSPTDKIFFLSRYSFEGVLQAIYGFDRGALDCKNVCLISKAADVLEEMDVENAKFYVDFIVLCIFFVIIRIGCYFVLRWRVKSQRWGLL